MRLRSLGRRNCWGCYYDISLFQWRFADSFDSSTACREGVVLGKSLICQSTLYLAFELQGFSLAFLQLSSLAFCSQWNINFRQCSCFRFSWVFYRALFQRNLDFSRFQNSETVFTVWATYVLSFLFNDQGVFPCFFDVMFPISQPMKNFVFMTNCPSSPSNPDICLIKDYISRI